MNSRNANHNVHLIGENGLRLQVTPVVYVGTLVGSEGYSDGFAKNGHGVPGTAASIVSTNWTMRKDDDIRVLEVGLGRQGRRVHLGLLPGASGIVLPLF
jgi:hypothetical protein